MTLLHGDDIYRYDGRIKMNFSSNVSIRYNLSRLKAYLSTQLDRIEHYPEPRAFTLEALIADKYGIAPCNVLITAGTTDAIWIIAKALTTNPFSLTHYSVKRPTFGEYDDASRASGYIEGEAKAHTLRWICNPNNPTGKAVSKKEMIQECTKEGIIVIDQSYETCTLEPLFTPKETIDNPKLILLHSLTKTYGIPGLRIGYITAHRDMIEKISQNLRPWAVDTLSLCAIKYLMENQLESLFPVKQLIENTKIIANRLETIEGIKTYPTSTTFILAKMLYGSAVTMKENLANKYGILIRECSDIRGLTPQHFRISTQKEYENECLIKAIKEYMISLRIELKGKEI